MSISGATAPAPLRTPQGLFRVGPPVRVDGRNQMTMDLAPGSGPVSTAALGVLLDDILGFTLFEHKGSRSGLVSAELSVDFVRPSGWQGRRLTAESRLERLDADGGLSSVRVVDGAGIPIATGTAWGNFVDGVEPTRGGAVADHVEAVDGPSAPPIELIGGHLERTETGARLTVPADRSLANSIGVMHGGIQACAYDLVGSALSGSGGSSAMQTSSLRINFFRPVTLDRPAVFDAEVVRAGRRVSVVQVTGRDGVGRTCGVATVTCRRESDETALD
ncbi:PaaI family thioesterase [Rhodococcus sp. NPDC059234]|uniref:PaaI family thioesterase n=1 Tax=Rhodococcus sp. NPDC059234 TaxID=3346781 RepID=UPI00367354A2